MQEMLSHKKVKHTITSCSFRDVETERAGHDKVVSLLLTSGRLLAVKRRKTATDCVRSLTVIAYSHILGCPSPSYTSSMLIIHTFTKTLKICLWSESFELSDDDDDDGDG